MVFFDNFQSSRLIGAHRGYRSCRPENTLSAFLAAVGRCHFVELDVQLSKDFVPVIFHDNSLERTSDAKLKRKTINKRSLKIANWTFSQLQNLEIGSWFLVTDPFGTLGNHEVSSAVIQRELPQRILTLENVLTHPKLQDMPFNVEIKNQSNPKYGKKITNIVLDVILQLQAQDRVLISSFNHDYLIRAKSLIPEITTAALQDYYHPRNLKEYLKRLGVSAYHPADAITDENLIHDLRSAGFHVNVYTVNDQKRQEELFQFGATAVITDFPSLAPPVA